MNAMFVLPGNGDLLEQALMVSLNMWVYHGLLASGGDKRDDEGAGSKWVTVDGRWNTPSRWWRCRMGVQ